jgi:glycosyltransferase involved in cell wall biosynthesis
MVTPYPPVRDGIAAYALQAVADLRSAGHEVEVLSPAPSAAHHHLDLKGPRGALALAKRVRSYDRVIVQFHPDFFYPLGSEGTSRALESLALAVPFGLARDLEVLVHEIDYSRGRRIGVAAAAERLLWRTPDRIVVHTEMERADMAQGFGIPRRRIEVEAHGGHFRKHVHVSRAEARAELNLPDEAFVFLAIGFIQPHKGFDRAIKAFAGLSDAGCRLDVVGSVRVEEPEYLAHLEELRRLSAAIPGTHLHEAYVTDAEFDRWLVAADTVVLPYRVIWSSGVLERAALYDRPIIATRVGGLADQAADRGGITIVDDDTGLAAAMRRAASITTPEISDPPQTWAEAEATDRESVMAAIRERAQVRRRGRPETLAADPSPPGGRARAAQASAPLRRLPALGLPPARSGKTSATLVKRLIRRLTAWQLEPVVNQVNRLQDATVDAVEGLAAGSRDEVS